MNGPTLTTAEIVSYLRLRVERFENLGISRDSAIRAVARDDGLDEEKVKTILGFPS